MFDPVVSMLVFPGFLFSIVFGLLFMGIDRKVYARMQNRIGPPIWQPFMDFIKLLSKETIKPALASWLFLLMPAVSCAAILTIMVLLPVGNFLDIENSLIPIIYLLLMSTTFTILAGFSSENPFGATGAIRNLVQFFAADFPLLVALFVPVVALGTLSVSEIASQGALFKYIPLATIAYLVAMQAELQRVPFDIPEAKQEIVAGLYTEYSGAGLALFELLHAFKFLALSSLAIFMFFGGAASIWIYLLKLLLIMLLITLIRAIFARIKISQVLRFYWILIGPLAVIDLIRVMLL